MKKCCEMSISVFGPSMPFSAVNSAPSVELDDRGMIVLQIAVQEIPQHHQPA